MCSFSCLGGFSGNGGSKIDDAMNICCICSGHLDHVGKKGMIKNHEEEVGVKFITKNIENKNLFHILLNLNTFSTNKNTS